MKKTLKWIFVFALVLGAFFALSLSSNALGSTGKCGENVTYSFEASSGKLTISGSGPMRNYSGSGSPFCCQKQIESVVITSGVTSIGEFAFDSCENLKSIIIPNSVISIGEYAFEYCSGLESISIPNGVKILGCGAFSDCCKLKSIAIPSSVVIIDNFVFSGCSGIASIKVSSKNTVYHSEGNCLIHTETGELILGCKSSIIPSDDSVSIIGDGAFVDCTKLTKVNIPNGVTRIGDFAFCECSSLSEISIPDSVISIGEHAFSNCKGLKSVSFGKNLISIGEFAFFGCDLLTKVTITNKVTSIDRYAFDCCYSINSISISSSVTYLGEGAFSCNNKLTSIIVDERNPVFHSSGNCLIKTKTKELLLGCKLSVIPDDGSVKRIGEFAFEYCNKMKSITIPSSITNIGVGAFFECDALNDIYFNGNNKEWNKIDIEDLNESIMSATIHFKKCYHVWDKGYITKPASCNATGVKTFTCIDCKTTRTESINTIPHSFTKKLDKATLTADGKITPTCSVCGATKTATVIPKASGVKISATSFIYNGKTLKPTLTVKDSKGNVIASKYYTATWSNSSSKAAGSYTVKVTFKGNYSGTKTRTYKIVPRQVTGLKAEAVEKTSINLSWTKLTEAKYYKVEQSTDGKTWKTVATVTTNSYTVTGLKAGTNYRFRVTALDSTKKIAGKESTALKTGTLTAAPKISKLTSTKAKTATVTWSKVTGAKSYIVYKSTDGKKFDKGTSTTETTLTLSKLTAGKKIYVKVVAVNVYGKNSAASAVKSVTVK